jgi:hypothetical protein
LYDKDSLSRAQVLRRFAPGKGDRESLEGDTVQGRQISAQYSENVDKTGAIVIQEQSNNY